MNSFIHLSFSILLFSIFYDSKKNKQANGKGDEISNISNYFVMGNYEFSCFYAYAHRLLFLEIRCSPLLLH